MSPGPDPAELPDDVEDILAAVEAIPAGRVATYGDVAAWVGFGGPRQVGRVLSRFGAAVPWWRVVRARGLPPQGHQRAAWSHYRREGTALLGPDADRGREDYRVDLSVARWRPEHPAAGGAGHGGRGDRPPREGRVSVPRDGMTGW